VQDGQPVESRPFVTGFRDSEDQQCGDAWGRPAGVEVGTNGELLISDDQNGNIYRVIYADEQQEQ
jgi:glucose/arabinose dehydrogenase